MLLHNCNLIFTFLFGVVLYLYDSSSSFVLFYLFFVPLLFIKLDELSPSFLIIPFIYFYNLSSYLLDFFDIRSFEHLDLIFFSNFIAVNAFLVASRIVNVKRVRNISCFMTYPRPFLFVKKINLLIFIMTVLGFYIVLDFYIKGYSGKNTGNFVFVHVFRFLNILYIYMVLKYGFKYLRDFLFLLLLLIFTLTLGERDIVFTYIMCYLILLIYNEKIKISQLIFLFIAFLPLVTTLGIFKNIFTRENIESVDLLTFMVLILDGEFRTSGFNLEVLFKSGFSDFFYGSKMIDEILRSFIPPFIYKIENSVTWYNTTYHPNVVNSGRGYGFSLIGAGFINFGFFGVFLYFFVFGLFINLSYKLIQKNDYFKIFYVSLIPISIYSLRGDFSTFFSPIFKSLLPIILIIFIINNLRSHVSN